MCLSPVPIQNLNKGLRNVGMNFLKDCSSAFLSVPCGHCSECIHNRQVGYLQRVQVEAKYSLVYALMLSYNDSHLCKIQAPDGKLFKYANWEHLQNMFKNLREDDAFRRPFRYFAVSEFGGDDPKSGRPATHRPHFHVLLFFPRIESDNALTPYHFNQTVFDTILKYWRVRLPRSTKRFPLYAPLLTYKVYRTRAGLRRNYDCQLISADSFTDSISNVAVYFTKYMLKDSGYAKRLQQALRLNYDDETYNRIWNVVKPRSSRSLGFGLAPEDCLSDPTAIRPEVFKMIRDGINVSKSSGSEFPQFFSLYDGKPMVLSRYYSNKYLTPDDRLAFLVNSDVDAVDGCIIRDPESKDDRFRKLDRSYHQVSSVLSKPDVLDDIDGSVESFSLSEVPDMPDFCGDSDLIEPNHDFDLSPDLPRDRAEIDAANEHFRQCVFDRLNHPDDYDKYVFNLNQKNYVKN